ncbi:HET-domain-containing protein, partial [Cadophora sp. DSE1049]
MAYQYSALDIKRSEIRLLVLNPGSRSNAIQCQLRTCSLVDSIIEYEALSYTWGTPCPRHHITIDSYSMSVNPALHIALSHLRYSTEPRILWVDAVCINQEDLKEREEQVTQMRLVYSCARRVLAWLGEEYESSDAAMSLLENIDMVDLKKLQDNNGGGASPSRVDWDALFALLRRPWWSRVWIIQEVTVGESEPLVGCGN